MIFKRLPASFQRWVYIAIAGVIPLWALLSWLPSATALAKNITPPTDKQRFIIQLYEAADLTDIGETEFGLRGAETIERLQQTAALSQQPLIDAWQQKGKIYSAESLWIINAIVVEGDPDVVKQLADLPVVQQIRLDKRRRFLSLDAPTQTVQYGLQARLTSGQNGPQIPWGIDQIAAANVWHGLGIRGNGVTIAIMDTGVDWLHPSLNGNYRGGSSGVHAGNWYDPISNSVEPFDPVWHGTHVAGTAVGSNGIGVAPQATWIAARIFDENGFTTESVIHQAFQWLLAPNGDPSLAPDIINASWSGSSASDLFLPDVMAIQAAGILPIFAAGNAGPAPNSVGSPASYPDTLAIGASDFRDEIAWFSSRGMSPLTNQPKPTFSAPGAGIYSAFPDNQFAFASGTSMAAPHVAGAAALLKSANPHLTNLEIIRTLTETVTPITENPPDIDAGWGRLNAMEAVGQAMDAGILQGAVYGNGLPLPQVTMTIATSSGAEYTTSTDDQGVYRLRLIPGAYQISIDVFGYHHFSKFLTVGNGIKTAGFVLNPLPGGAVTGVVKDSVTQQPLAEVNIIVEGSSLGVASGSDGSFHITLPAGNHQLSFEKTGFGYKLQPVAIVANQFQQLSPQLDPISRTLLIDDSGWYYHQRGHFWQAALHDLGMSHDLITLFNPFTDLPTAAELAEYDLIVWSSPDYSPGYVLGGDNLHAYLESGGDLLVSGQNVAYYETFGGENWFVNDLGASYQSFLEPPYLISGTADSLFAGISYPLNGGDSDDNQSTANQIRVWRTGVAEPILGFADAGIAGAQSGYCQDYDVILYSFGLEGIPTANGRAELLDRGIAALNQPLRKNMAQFEEAELFDYAPAGEILTYTVAIRNLSEVMTDTFQLSIAGNSWHTDLLSNTITIPPCQTGEFSFRVFVPANAPKNVEHSFNIDARLIGWESPAASITVRHQTPGHFLFVDDDRFYNREADYQTALDNLGISYDTLNIGSDAIYPHQISPELLKAYDIIFWYTGYDWFMPITSGEEEALEAFLEDGGRLFLSSQDYLFYHQNDPLTTHFLGVHDYSESVTPTVAFAADSPILSQDSALSFAPYQNFGDGVMPGHNLPERRVKTDLWSDAGMPAAIAASGKDWRTAFWGIPWETLPASAQAETLNGVVGWLSDLGDSTIEASPQHSAAPGERQVTITLRTVDLGFSHQVSIVNQLPMSLTIDPMTLSGGATYDPVTRRVSWEGKISSGGVRQIAYRAHAGILDGAIPHHLEISYQQQIPEGHQLRFYKIATSWVNAPNYSATIWQIQPQPARPADPITATLHLLNLGAAVPATVTIPLHPPLEFKPGTIDLSSNSGTITVQGNQIVIEDLPASNDPISVTFTLSPTFANLPLLIPLPAFIEPSGYEMQIIPATIQVDPYQYHIPIIAID